MLSVILPSRDRAPLLRQALSSLREQSLRSDRFEVLVVDNGSTDDTRLVVESAREHSANVRYIYDPRPGLHVGRHRGLQEAVGDVLVFADDDIRATPGWLAAVAENFTDPGIALVGGNNYPDFKEKPPVWLDQLWQRPSLGGQAISFLSVLALPEGRRPISPFLVWGCNFSIRRNVLLDAGGFHPDAMPQDLIRFRGDGETHVSRFVADRGLGCVLDSRASVFHAVTAERMTVQYFRRRAYNQGISDSYTRLRCGDTAGSRARFLAAARRVADGIYARLQEFRRDSPAIRDLQAAIRKGYREGFAYHRIMYGQDAELRDWVHRPDYY